MTDQEKAVMRDAYKILSFYGEPPAAGAVGEDDWWKRFADDLCVFSSRNEQHPLALEIGCAISSYIEHKAKEK